MHRKLVAVVGLWAVAGAALAATGMLENPQQASPQSGIGLISGWVCPPVAVIEVAFDAGAKIPVPYGSPRADTASVCGGQSNSNSGFGLLLNFNTLGAGVHNAQMYVNGTALGSPTQFVVTIPAVEFLSGASKQVTVADFPLVGASATLRWQESQQNFTISGVTTKALDSVAVKAGPTASLENPQSSSSQSGIGLLSGWSCQGPAIGIAIDGGPPQAVPYGSARADTASVCGVGNTNTGFGLLLNFNLLGAGTHSAQLYVNGTALGSSTQFTVTVPGGEFLTGVSKQVTVPAFPVTNVATTLTWQEAKQNFAIQSVSSPPLPSYSSLARQCAAPRPANATDPFTGNLYDDRQGSLVNETAWIRSYVNETYLWYDEVPVIDPAPYVIGATVAYVDPGMNIRSSKKLNTNVDIVDAYFNSQRSPFSTPSGKPRDQFHFTYATADWVALATGGDAAGFGFAPALLAGYPPRDIRVAYTDPGTPAAQNALNRGARLLAINGVNVANGSDVDTLNEALFSPVLGKQYTFEVLDVGSATSRIITMTAANITPAPVQNVGTLPAPNNSVGYMLFNDHIATAESALIDAVKKLNAANNGSGISDLVLDIRYNGGGYLDIASELAYMIAGATATRGKTFERLSYNSKNPFGLTVAQETTPFHSTSQGFSTTAGQALPQLGLSRVFVITTADTCSASEAIINGLRGAGVNVIQIGGVTCGKPYGFFPKDNCGTTYFTIQFKGVNAAGFGDYAEGFIPGGTGVTANNLPGCAAADDFSRGLGDPAEGLLAAALQFRAAGACPAINKSAPGGLRAAPALVRSPLRENRIFRSNPRQGSLP